MQHIFIVVLFFFFLSIVFSNKKNLLISDLRNLSDNVSGDEKHLYFLASLKYPKTVILKIVTAMIFDSLSLPRRRFIYSLRVYRKGNFNLFMANQF